MSDKTQRENQVSNNTIRENNNQSTFREPDTPSRENNVTTREPDRTFREENRTIRESNKTFRDNESESNDRDNATLRENALTVVEGYSGTGTGNHARQRVNLPTSVEENYEWVQDVQYPSGEADLMIVRERETGVERFFKLYRSGISPHEDVLSLLQNECSRDDVVSIIDYSVEDSQGAWEIQEYLPLGSLDWGQWANRNKFPYNEELIRNILKEASKSIHGIHATGEGIAHRDIKPSNILIKSDSPLDLVLTDFGIARDDQDVTHRTTFAGTILYAAPEAHRGNSSTKSDWFALGAIIFELFTNRKLLGSKGDWNPGPHTALANCISRDYYKNVNEKNIVDESWQQLIKGLVTYEREHRWGYAEIQRWLNGEMPDVWWVESKAGTADFSAEDCYQPPWEKDFVTSPLELVRSLANNWDEAKKALKGRELPEIKKFLSNFQGSEVAVDLINSNKSSERKLLELQLMVDKENDPIYNGKSLNAEIIKSQINDANNDDKKALQWLYGLVRCDALILYGNSKNDIRTANAGRSLQAWYRQAEEVKKLVPRKKHKIADAAFVSALPELFIKAYE